MLLSGVTLLAVLTVLAVALLMISPRTSPAGPASLPQRPMSYRTLFRTDTWIYGQDLARWELLTVARPFGSSDLTYDAPPGPGMAPVSGYVSTEQALYDVDAGGMHLVAGKQPGVASGDQDLLTQMPEMVARNLAADTGSVRDIAGLRCHVYRLHEPPAGAIAPLAGAGDHDDICLAANGLILSEAWTYKSHLVYSRRALEISLKGVSLPQAYAAAPAPAGAPTVRTDPSPSSFLVPPPAPAGYQAAGSYDFSVAEGQSPQVAQAESVVWVFVNGPDVVTVEAGASADGALPWEGGKAVVEGARLPGFTKAQSAIRSDGAEVRIDAGHGDWVRVRGTVPVTWLVRYAAALRMA